ncbi:MAG TPA: TatD family hydrolase [Niastella sp.]|nr:TatD family hydrolase [Niastella sp.]
MQLIDTHAHIYLPEFDADREEALTRASTGGVEKILMPAIDSGTHEHMLSVAAKWKYCHGMMGLHPCSVTETFKDELHIVSTYLQNNRFVAIGEIGLDFYWDITYKQQQYEAFETQIQWALQYDLPIVIHSRNAMDECIEVVRRFPGLRGVFHCFSGTVAQARQVMDLSFYLGIGGVLTYKNAGLDKVVEAIGLTAVVLETDAPYLAPVPYRGKRNECSYLPLIAEKLAAVSGQTKETVARITTQNAMNLFRLL